MGVSTMVMLARVRVGREEGEGGGWGVAVATVRRRNGEKRVGRSILDCFARSTMCLSW